MHGQDTNTSSEVATNSIVVSSHGPDAVLEQARTGIGRPAGAQVLIAVRLAGVNYWDIMQRRGQVPLPASGIPGVEGVGVVVECGPDAPAGLLGRRVAWSKVAGSYADRVLASAELVIEVPDEVPDEVAAGVLMQGITAQYLADDTCPLGAGESAVVFAAAGGVGSLLTQCLGHRGVQAVAVVGADAKVVAARTAGASDVVVDGPDLVEQVRELVPSGVSAVFDANGGALTPRGFDLLRPRGMLVLYGTAAGPLPPFDTARMGTGSLYLTRASGKDYAGTAADWQRRAAIVMARAASGELRVQVGRCADLAQAAELHELMQTRASTGKLLLRMPGSV
ncbi:MAG: zinc-binding dehydrogenase [Jatrophihabitantaceae bacterium]